MKKARYESSMSTYLYGDQKTQKLLYCHLSVCSLRQKISKEKAFFSKLHDKYCQNARNPLGIVNIPLCDVITKIRTFLFLT